jgi:hypothetical protein
VSCFLLAGGTGLVGRRFSEILLEKGHTVRLLTRTPRGAGQFAWDPARGQMDESALDRVDCVVNLAGAGIAEGRWTAARKRLLVDSRVQSAQVLAQAMQRRAQRPQVYVSASAIGYYGDSGEQPMREADAPVGAGFMVDCCQQWERAAAEPAALGIRTVTLRIGVVLDLEGGALAEFVKPLRFGVGGYFGDGSAWCSWIHRDDLCHMLLWAAENQSISGVFNAVAPHPERNKALLQGIVRARRKPALLLPAPRFALRLLLGEMSAVILNSNRVSAEKALEAGFRFQYPELSGALADIFGRARKS